MIEILSDLKNAYHICAMYKWDDLIYTHISSRVDEDYFYILPFGVLFSEVTEKNLVKLSIKDIDDKYSVNPTGAIIHSAIYNARKDINHIFHLHTIAGTSVSSMACGLLPISQFSFPFFNRVSYYNYDSLALDRNRHGSDIARVLGDVNKVMFLNNHGTITCGSNIYEAFFFTRFLEMACMVQCNVLATNMKSIIPDEIICEQAAQDMLSFEHILGKKDWDAALRTLQTLKR